MNARPVLYASALTLLAAPAFAQEPPKPPPARDTVMEERTQRLLQLKGTWTADMAASRARATSLDVAAKQEALRASAAKVDQAVVGFFPILSGVGRYARLSALPSPTSAPIQLASPAVQGAPGAPIAAGTPLIAIPLSFPVVLDTFTFQGTLTVPISDYVFRTSQSYTSASRNQEAARQDKVAAEAKAQADARLAFYQWVKAAGQKEVLEQALLATKEHLRDAQNLFKVGTASKADVLAVEAQVASGELAVEQSLELVEVSLDQLRTLTHAADDERVSLGEDVTTALPRQSYDLAALKQEAFTRRPELLALAAAEQSLEKSAAVARAGELPRLDAFGDYIYANPNTRIFPQEAKFHGTWDVGLQVTWTANDAFKAGGAGAEIEANAARIRAQRAQLRDAVSSEVTASVMASRTADVSVQTNDVALAAAEEAYRVRRELYKVGKSTSVELSDAEATVFRARLTAVNARIDQRIARVRVEHAAGRDVAAPARRAE
jgi:outer membrane protein TolC